MEKTERFKGMKIYLVNLIQDDWSLNLKLLPEDCNTKYIAITGNNNWSKITLRKILANYFVDMQKIVVTDKSDLDCYEEGFFIKAIKKAKQENQEYTLQLFLSFLDGLLSNYLVNLRGRCDYFIFDRSPIDQYLYCNTLNGNGFLEIYKIQKPERFEKIDYYIYLDCATNELEVKSENSPSVTKKLYEEVVEGNRPELDFARTAKHYYVDATNLTNEELMQQILDWLEKN